MRALDAEPPPPGTITDASFVEAVAWRSNPLDLGQLNAGPFNLGDVYLVDINSSSITLDVTPDGPLPVTVSLEFETGGEEEVQDLHDNTVGAMDLEEFSVILRMSLQAFAGQVELFMWINDLDALRRSAVFNSEFGITTFSGSWLGQQLAEAVPGEPDDAFDQLLSGLLDDVIDVAVTTWRRGTSAISSKPLFSGRSTTSCRPPSRSRVDGRAAISAGPSPRSCSVTYRRLSSPTARICRTCGSKTMSSSSRIPARRAGSRRCRPTGRRLFSATSGTYPRSTTSSS